MSKRLGGTIGCKYKTSYGILTGSPMVVTLGQQYNGKKATVILYTGINRHAGTAEKSKNKKKRQCSTPSNMVVIIY